MNRFGVSAVLVIFVVVAVVSSQAPPKPSISYSFTTLANITLKTQEQFNTSSVKWLQNFETTQVLVIGNDGITSYVDLHNSTDLQYDNQTCHFYCDHGKCCNSTSANDEHVKKFGFQHEVIETSFTSVEPPHCGCAVTSLEILIWALYDNTTYSGEILS